jgi:hypothetical protein
MMHKEYFWLILIVAIIVFGPLCSIWALNTLFPVLAIPYTFETWLAVILLGGVVNSRSFKSNT